MGNIDTFESNIVKQLGDAKKNIKVISSNVAADLNTANNLRVYFYIATKIRVVGMALVVATAATGGDEVLTCTDGTTALTVTLLAAGAPVSVYADKDQVYDAGSKLTISNGGASTGGATLGQGFIYYVDEEDSPHR